LFVSRRDSGQLEIASDLPNGRPERELIHFKDYSLGLRPHCGPFLVKTNYYKMAKTREQKSAHLNELQDIAKNSQSVVFVSFDKLPVKDETSLRSTLTKNSVNYKVVKKTLLKKAFAESAIQGDMPELKGMVAVAYGNELIAPSREVYAFQKELAEKLQIVGGVFEGKYMTQAEMMSIATIPSTPVLYAQLLSMFNAPIQSFVSVLHQYAEKKEA